MKRRAFLAGAAVFALPARAQARVHRVGIVLGQNPQNADSQRLLRVFVEALKQRGYEDGRNMTLAVRYYHGDRARIPAIADELIEWRADVLVANVSSTAVALKSRTNIIPIVMVTAVDAVREGLVASLARPGGNVTGMTSFGSQAHGKLVELGTELMPGAKRFALLVNPDHALADSYGAAASQAAKTRGVTTVMVKLSGTPGLETLGDDLRKVHADLLIVLTDAVLYALRDHLVQAATRARLPVVAFLQEFISVGAVATLGSDFVDNYRSAARYVDQILKGAKPGELPVEQPNQFDLILNLKAARSLGVTVPATVLARANKVIE